MKLIVGLGNPGKKYVNNRHNLGYVVADEFVKKEAALWKKDADLLCYLAKTKDFIVIKPTTFMNESGNSVRLASKFFKVGLKDVLVICDDLDLPFGKIRLSFDGSSAGHKGVDSVIACMGGVDFGRLRIGIGRPSQDVSSGNQNAGADYVLKDFLPEEQKFIGGIIDKSVEAIGSYLTDGIMATMNRFN